jgi:hypothetical protein
MALRNRNCWRSLAGNRRFGNQNAADRAREISHQAPVQW